MLTIFHSSTALWLILLLSTIEQNEARAKKKAVPQGRDVGGIKEFFDNLFGMGSDEYVENYPEPVPMPPPNAPTAEDAISKVEDAVKKKEKFEAQNVPPSEEVATVPEKEEKKPEKEESPPKKEDSESKKDDKSEKEKEKSPPKKEDKETPPKEESPKPEAKPPKKESTDPKKDEAGKEEEAKDATEDTKNKRKNKKKKNLPTMAKTEEQGGIFDFFGSAIDTVVSPVTNMLDPVVKPVKSAFDPVVNFTQGLIKPVTDISKPAADLVSSIVSPFLPNNNGSDENAGLMSALTSSFQGATNIVYTAVYTTWQSTFVNLVDYGFSGWIRMALALLFLNFIGLILIFAAPFLVPLAVIAVDLMLGLKLVHYFLGQE